MIVLYSFFILFSISYSVRLFSIDGVFIYPRSRCRRRRLLRLVFRFTHALHDVGLKCMKSLKQRAMGCFDRLESLKQRVGRWRPLWTRSRPSPRAREIVGPPRRGREQSRYRTGRTDTRAAGIPYQLPQGE